MTARAMFVRRRRWIGGTMYAAIGLFLVGLVIGVVVGPQATVALALPASTVAIAINMIARFAGFRCPGCRGNMAPLFLEQVRPLMDPGVYFCPYCGVRLDEELPTEESVS